MSRSTAGSVQQAYSILPMPDAIGGYTAAYTYLNAGTTVYVFVGGMGVIGSNEMYEDGDGEWHAKWG